MVVIAVIIFLYTTNRLPGNLRKHISTKIEFVIILKSTKTLGLDVPPKLLAHADEVIE